MKRRGFIAALAGAFVAPDPDKLLWRPGAKLISIPNQQFVVNYSYTSVVPGGYAFYDCFSERKYKDAAILFARNRKYYLLSQGALDFTVKLKEPVKPTEKFFVDLNFPHYLVSYSGVQKIGEKYVEFKSPAQS